MGKKSRRKAPKAQRERKELVPTTDYRADHLVRYRQPGYYDVDARAFNLLCAHENYMVEMYADDVKTAEEERDRLGEFIHLVLFPTHKNEGLEAALRLVKRWSKFKSHFCPERRGLTKMPDAGAGVSSGPRRLRRRGPARVAAGPDSHASSLPGGV